MEFLFFPCIRHVVPSLYPLAMLSSYGGCPWATRIIPMPTFPSFPGYSIFAFLMYSHENHYSSGLHPILQ
jgi:hypothetical protein